MDSHFADDTTSGSIQVTHPFVFNLSFKGGPPQQQQQSQTKKDAKKKKKKVAGGTMSKQMQLKRKMSNDGFDPYMQMPGAELQLKNHTEKAKQLEQKRLKEQRERERKKKKNSSASSESEASPETTEGELSGESDKSDNEDLPDYKENGYHAVHVG